jgi:fructokinase
MNHLYGGVEAGGTKFICAIGNLEGEILAHQEIPTGSPNDTILKIEHFFKSNQAVSAVGVGSFGPIELNPDSAEYGHIKNSPKIDWRNVDIRGEISRALDLEVKITTDVICSALGEYYYGSARGLNNFLYLTVGTGIGGAQLLNGKPPQSTTHPEMGHMLVPHDLDIDPFPGICPYHSDCLEGLASGLSMERRAGVKAEKVIDPYRWDLEVRYLAFGITNLLSTLRPQKIILGGGITEHGGLIEAIDLMVQELMNNYIPLPEIALASELNAIKGAIRLAHGDL